MSADPLRVLVVDDNQTAAMAAAMLLRREGHAVDACTDGAEAIRRIEEHTYDLLLTDLRMEPVDGLAVLRAARSRSPPIEVIVMTAYSSVEAAVEAMRRGAVDFLTKPVTAELLVSRVAAFRRAPTPGPPLLGDSPVARAVREEAARVAPVRSAALITGETGTGRRHLARWLHDNGPDRERPLVLAVPSRLPPIAELRAAGSVLLPHIDDWEPDALHALVLLLTLIPPGSPPRVLATASPEIGQRAARGELPADLYFRLAVMVLHLPPLRARPDDIAPILQMFLERHARQHLRPPLTPGAETLARLRAHAWPGNLRELENLAERATVMGPQALDALGPAGPPPAGGLPALGDGFDLAAHLEWTERTLLEQAHAKARGDIREMVRLTGLERNRLRYKLNKYELLDRGR
jgi:DNA-binding NtrC family response regulator